MTRESYSLNAGPWGSMKNSVRSPKEGTIAWRVNRGMFSEGHRASRTRYALISNLGLMAIATTATLVGPSFPSIMKEFNVPFGLLGFLASAWNLGYLLTSFGGMLSDRHGEVPVLGAGFAAVGLAAGLVSIAPSYELLVGLLLLGGTGAAFAEAAMNPLISRLYPERSGFALNILHLFFSLGAFVGPALAGLLIVKYASWRLPYTVSSLAFIPLIAATLILIRAKGFDGRNRRRPSGFETNAERESLSRVLKRGRALAFAGFFYLGSELGTNAWLPTFLIVERSFPVELASLSVGLFWAAMAGGRLALGSLSDRFGYKRMMTLCSAIAAIVILAGALVENRYVLVALWSLLGFIFGPIMPTIFAWTNKLFPSRPGFATGAIYSAAFLGAIFSPWLLGELAQLYSLKMSIFYLAFSTCGICISVLLIKSSTSMTRTEKIP